MDKQTMSVFTEGAKVDASGNSAGYQVDKDGFIELPVLGRIQVGGLSLQQAREKVRDIAMKYYIDPAVNIRYANFYVTVLGDVASPGRKLFPSEKVTILDVISASGDMQVTARRENVLIIRDEGGHKSYGRVDLNSTDVYQSPYYYVRSGDLVYVEQNKVKAKSATVDYSRDRYIAYATSFLSIFISLYTIITLNNR
jgi:polysaccharide export outer membrane protein